MQKLGFSLFLSMRLNISFPKVYNKFGYKKHIPPSSPTFSVLKQERRPIIPDLGSTTFLVVIDNSNVCNIITAAVRLGFAWKKWTSITISNKVFG
jgi:hypothetical protein